MIKMRGIIISWTVVMMLLSIFSSAAAALNVYPTSPWLGMVARFIGGDYATIYPLSTWSPSGSLLMVRRNADNGMILALDRNEIATFGYKKERPNIALLYQKLPDWGEARESIYYDPSKLPFLAQRVLKAFSRHAPENYPYYQRRLAEFQSRLESTLEVGRHLLPSTGGLDFTGAAGPWIRSAMPGMVRPPLRLWNAWKKGESLDELQAALVKAQARQWCILTDSWTPPRILERVSSFSKHIRLSPPKGEQEIFGYLNDIYLDIYNQLKKTQ